MIFLPSCLDFVEPLLILFVHLFESELFLMQLFFLQEMFISLVVVPAVLAEEPVADFVNLFALIMHQ
jgi:hypothetical protein